ncbi:MAG: Holliday junction resolvase RuvX, partial [Gammaproteobacteria bacterium]
SALVVGQAGNANEPALARFCRQLAGRFNLPVHTVAEDYTSSEAYERLRVQRCARRKPIAKPEIDQLAAAILLEAWMAQQR